MIGKHIPTIAIIGGGFSGAAVAWHLRRKPKKAVEIIVIEPRAEIGRGLAYSTTDPTHRINVPAVRMNIDANDDNHFLRWLISTNYPAKDPQAALPDGRLFPSRYAFGSYVSEQIRSFSDPVKHITAKASNVEAVANGFRVACQTGETISADIVILAVCHAPPDTPASLTSLQTHPRFFANPWRDNALQTIRPNDRVLIVGTGLTMADTVASLDRTGHRGEIVAISRRGLRSQPHTDNPAEFDGDFIMPPAERATELLVRIRIAIDKAIHDGLTWQAVIDRVRNQCQEIWRALPAPARSRVLRHLRPFWDTHRFRIAPQVHEVVERRIKNRTLNIQAASVRAHSTSPNAIIVAFRRRHGQDWMPSTFDALVLATGPAHATVVSRDPLLSRMNGNGLIHADAFGLGVDVDLEGHAINRAGASIPNLFVAGPLARGTFGELMGISDLATYAETIAGRILHDLDAQADISHTIL